MKRATQPDRFIELNHNRLIHRQPSIVDNDVGAASKKKSAGGKTKDFSSSFFEAVQKYVSSMTIGITLKISHFFSPLRRVCRRGAATFSHTFRIFFYTPVPHLRRRVRK